MLKFN